MSDPIRARLDGLRVPGDFARYGDALRAVLDLCDDTGLQPGRPFRLSLAARRAVLAVIAEHLGATGE